MTIATPPQIADRTRSLPAGYSAEKWAANWRHVLWAIMVCCWLVDGVVSIRGANGDAISYMEIAGACVKGNWHALVNAYWSPGYPALLAVWWSIFGHSLYWEGLSVVLLNCVILVGALSCCEYFLVGLTARLSPFPYGNAQRSSLPVWALQAILYTLFLWITLYLDPASDKRADALVLAVVLLAEGILLRIANGKDGWLRFAMLGVVLGVGYLCKAVMFSLAFVFLAAAFLAAGNFRRTLPRALLAVFFFFVVALPFVIAISKSKGRLTYGDVGGIAYAEEVNGVRKMIHWQGGPPGFGTPKHPTRELLKVPPVYEFAAPVGGSYPPWVDPSYWYDGVQPHFQLREQLVVLYYSIKTYYDLFFVRQGCLVAGFLVLLCWTGSFSHFARNLARDAFLWGPGVLAIGLYGLVLADGRYLGGFLLPLFAGLFGALPVLPMPSLDRVVRAATLAIVLSLGIQIAYSLLLSTVQLPAIRKYPEWEVVKGLRSSGIGPGDMIADVDSGLTIHYWAHLAGVRIVAEVPEAGVADFWASSPEVKSQVLYLFAQSGARAVVAKNVPAPFSSNGWIPVSNSSYSIYLLQKYGITR